MAFDRVVGFNSSESVGLRLPQVVRDEIEAVVPAFALTPTGVMTENYTAQPSDYVYVDSTAAPVTVTLPASPPSGSLVAVYLVDGENAVTLLAAGGAEFIRDGSAVLTVELNGAERLVTLSLWRYNSGGNVWQPVTYHAAPATTDILGATPIGVALMEAATSLDVRNLAQVGNPRVASMTSSGAPSFDVETTDVVNLTAQATSLNTLSTGLAGTPADAQTLVLRVKDNGTSRALAYGAKFANSDTVAAPTATTVGKTHELCWRYNAAAAKFYLFSVVLY